MRRRIVESWHRFYDPSTGRYISADPIGLAGGMNLYAYVGGNPVNAVDPRGLDQMYGNFCGPNWTGGYSKEYNQLSSDEIKGLPDPWDDLDNCCKQHDICYADCREKYPCDEEKRADCFKKCDFELADCANNCVTGDPAWIQKISLYMNISNPDSGANRSNCPENPFGHCSDK